MEFHVLGTLGVRRDESSLELGGAKQRTLLALLLVDANRVVATDQLLEALWGQAGDDLRNRLWVHISNLRSLLEPERERPGSGDVLLTRASGYVLRVDENDLDSARFERLAAEGRSLLDVDPEQASRVLREALGLWRGRAYQDFLYEDFAQDEIRRLTELRIGAVEDRVDADLRSGRAREVVTETEALCGQHPLRERLRALHMLALYRSGRQVEALRAYQRTRSHLANELGLDPSRELATLHERILAQDPTLDALVSLSTPGPAGGVRGYELRGELGRGPLGVVHRAYQSSVAREVALKVIRGPVADTSEFIARFEDEVRQIARLEHPHVVPLHDWWREPGAAYLAMPVLGGGDLEKYLNTLPGHGARLELIEQVGGALAHAHRRGQPHGNIKPTNVLVDAEHNGYLADFGLTGTPDDDHRGPEQGSGGPATAAADIHALGVVARRVLATGADPEPVRPLAEVLDRATATEPHERFEDVGRFLRALRQALGRDVVALPPPNTPQAPIRNPYKGLRAFQQDDAEDFFGRDALVDRLVQAMEASALVAVVGPSGSGKSSVVKAGLLPRLQQGDACVLVTEMFPGHHPFEELETALRRVAARPPDRMPEELASGPRGLLRVVKQVLPDYDSTLVLVIDQFEELFSLVEREDTRALFLDSLVAATRERSSRLGVVLTLRADFFDRPLEYQGFGELVETGLVPVSVPSDDELARAVSGPAHHVGLGLEPGLVAAAVGEVAGQPGSLPLMQYALTELVEHRDGDVLTLEAYRRGGGVSGALGRRAEELYRELNESGREAARQAFLRLVAMDQGSEGTRRRVRRSELAQLDVDQGELDNALHRFGTHRLLSFDMDPVTRGPTVEVAHEALLREWDRLAGWIDDRRDELVLSRRISAAASDWVESGQDPSFLLRGANLAQAEAWWEDSDIAATTQEETYLEASRENRLDEEAASRRRRRWTTAILSVGLVVVGIAAAIAVVQRGVAQTEARREQVRSLAASSTIALEEDPELALLLALEAAEVSREADEPIQPEAIVALQAAVQSSRLEQRFDTYIAVGFGPDTEPVLEELEHFDTYPDQWPGASVSPDGRLVAERVLDDDRETGEVVVWEAATREELARLTPRTSSGDRMFVTDQVHWHPDGRFLTAETSDRTTDVGRLKVWDTGTWEEVQSFPMSYEYDDFAPDTIFGSVVTFPDSDSVAVHDPGGDIVLYDPATGDELDRIANPAPSASRFVLDPERDRLLLGTYGRPPERVEQWDLTTGELEWSTKVPVAGNVAFSSATGMVASFFGFTSDIHLHDPDTGEVVEVLRGHRDPVLDVFFSPDGSQLVSRSPMETLVWDITPAGPPEVGTIQLADDPDPVPRASSPGDTEVAVMNANRFSRYRLSDGQVLGETERAFHGLAPAVVSDGWSRSAVLGPDGRGVVLDPGTGDVIAALPECSWPSALSSDGGLVAVNGVDLCSAVDAPPDADLRSRVISVSTGEEVLDLGEQGIFGPFGAAFNPSGSFEADRYLAAIFSPRPEVLEVHDVQEGELVARLLFDTLPINVSFDPRGRYVGVGVIDGTAHVLDLEMVVNGTPVEDALVFSRSVDTGAVGMQLGPDGLMATHVAGSLKLWDFRSGEHLFDMPVSVEDQRPVPLFLRDGETMLYRDLGSQGDFVLRRFPLDPAELVALAQDRVTRDLTPEECQRYRLDC